MRRRLAAWRRRRSWHHGVRLQVTAREQVIVDLDSDNLYLIAKLGGGGWDLLEGALGPGAIDGIQIRVTPVDLPNW